MSEIERELAKELIENGLRDWREGRLLDYLLSRQEDEPLGRPTEVECALWRALVSTREQLATLRVELEKIRKPAPHGNPNIPEVCNSCGRPLLLANLYVDDGCPCNSPRGVNFTPKSCELCGLDCCVKPGHRLKELFGFSDEIQSDLERSAEICALKEEELATLRVENERLKRERDEAHSFADALEVRIETWRGMHKDAIERADSAERQVAALEAENRQLRGEE